MSFEVLESVLRPLSYWYNQDNIEEVAINRAGQVWLRLRGKRAYPWVCLLYTSPSPRDAHESRMPSSA